MVGDIIFVRTKSPLSWLIRKLTRSEWSHVAVIMGERFLIESDFLKPVRVRKNNYKEFKIVKLHITDLERLELVSSLLDRTNQKYDYGRIGGILLYLIGMTKNRNLWNNLNRDICDELVIRGLTILANAPKELSDAMTPGDVANILLKSDIINQE
jgi:hypothetical protein